MGTSNFHTQEDFPLVVIGSDSFMFAILDDDEEETGETEFDDWAMEDWIRFELKPRLENLNETLGYHRVTVKSGYYDGVQMWVDTTDNYDEDEEECKQEALALGQKMIDIGQEIGMTVLATIARFSNGETFYAKVDNPTWP